MPRVSTLADSASMTAPATLSDVRINNVRRRPIRSEKKVTSSVLKAAPASPEPMTNPMAFAFRSRLAR